MLAQIFYAVFVAQICKSAVSHPHRAGRTYRALSSADIIPTVKSATQKVCAADAGCAAMVFVALALQACEISRPSKSFTAETLLCRPWVCRPVHCAPVWVVLTRLLGLNPALRALTSAATARDPLGCKKP